MEPMLHVLRTLQKQALDNVATWEAKYAAATDQDVRRAALMSLKYFQGHRDSVELAINAVNMFMSLEITKAA